MDRTVSIGAFEHFADGVGTYERYDDLFKMCYQLLPADGVMLLYSIGLQTTMSVLRFIHFILSETYQGGRLPQTSIVDEHATKAGCEITRHHTIGSNYVRALDNWANSLEAHRDQAIADKDDEHETFLKYLTGCRELFHDGYTNVCQFTMVKPAA